MNLKNVIYKSALGSFYDLSTGRGYKLDTKNNNLEFICAHINNINKLKSKIKDLQNNISTGILVNNPDDCPLAKQNPSSHTLVKK